MTTTTLIEGERGGGHHHRARKEMNRYPSSNESYEKDEKTDHQKDRVIKMRRKKQKAFLALEQQHRTMGMTTSSNRKVDKPLVFFAALILCLVIFVELKTSPRKIARRAMESVEHLFHYVEKGGEVHAQMLRWRGWHSLEVGVEIACALTLAFLNWLLFASLFDVAGIVVGLIPAMATFLGVLVFRFHARSYFVLALIPLVVVPAIGCAKLLERRMRVKEERRMKARKERRREQRMARETRHQNGFVANDNNNNNNNNNMNNSEDPTRASGRTTIDATVMRRAMSQGELSPTTRVVSSSGMNPSLSAAAANGTIKGFNALSNGNGGGKAAPIMPAKVNALAGQPRHARGSSAPELGFNQLSSSSSSSSSLQRQQQQQPGEGAQNTAAGPQLYTISILWCKHSGFRWRRAKRPAGSETPKPAPLCERDRHQRRRRSGRRRRRRRTKPPDNKPPQREPLANSETIQRPKTKLGNHTLAIRCHRGVDGGKQRRRRRNFRTSGESPVGKRRPVENESRRKQQHRRAAKRQKRERYKRY